MDSIAGVCCIVCMVGTVYICKWNVGDLMANKHEAWDLAQMQSLSLESKIRMTQQASQIQK